MEGVLLTEMVYRLHKKISHSLVHANYANHLGLNPMSHYKYMHNKMTNISQNVNLRFMMLRVWSI